jgi:hypothetical protein
MPMFVNQPAGTSDQACSYSRGQIAVTFPPEGSTLGDGLFVFTLKGSKGETVDEVLLPISSGTGVTSAISYSAIDPTLLKRATAITCAFYPSADLGPRDFRVGKRDCGSADAPPVVDHGYIANITSAEIIGKIIRIAYVVDWSTLGSIDVGAFGGQKVIARVDGIIAATTLNGRAPLSGVIAFRIHQTIPREIVLGGLEDGVLITSRICLA